MIASLPGAGVRCGYRTVMVAHVDRRGRAGVFQSCARGRRDLGFAVTVHVEAYLWFAKKVVEMRAALRAKRTERGEEGWGEGGRVR